MTQDGHYIVCVVFRETVIELIQRLTALTNSCQRLTTDSEADSIDSETKVDGGIVSQVVL